MFKSKLATAAVLAVVGSILFVGVALSSNPSHERDHWDSWCRAATRGHEYMDAKTRRIYWMEYGAAQMQMSKDYVLCDDGATRVDAITGAIVP